MGKKQKKTKKKAVPAPKEIAAAPAPLLATAATPVTQYSYVPTQGPMATVAFDTNNDGNANFMVTGVDRNQDGIPDALQDNSYKVPQATVGVDTSGDGRANYNMQGVDINRDGIPDFLQSPRMQPLQPVGQQVFTSPIPSRSQPVYGTAMPAMPAQAMPLAQPTAMYGTAMPAPGRPVYGTYSGYSAMNPAPGGAI